MKKTRFSAQFNKRPVKDGVFPCDEIRTGDGLDPRFDTWGKKKIVNRKALQLCAQVSDLLSLALPECFEDLYVHSVVPNPDSTQLLVTVSSLGEVDGQDVVHALKGLTGKLRSEVAAGICRKRVPNLIFNYVYVKNQENS